MCVKESLGATDVSRKMRENRSKPFGLVSREEIMTRQSRWPMSRGKSVIVKG